MSKLFIPVLIGVFLLLPLAYADYCSITDYNISAFAWQDTFEYVYPYNQTYNFSMIHTGYAGFPQQPKSFSDINSTYSLAFGDNNALIPSTVAAQIRKINAWTNTYLNDTSKKYIIRFDYYANESAGQAISNTILDITLTSDNYNGRYMSFVLKNITSSLTAWEIENYFNNSVVTRCYTNNYSIGVMHHVDAYIDNLNKQYSIYIDGDFDSRCVNIGAASPKFKADGIDIIMYPGVSGSPFRRFVDNIEIGSTDGTCVDRSAAASCAFPLLFCDDFNYALSMYSQKGWNVYEAGNSIDRDFAPINHALSLNEPYAEERPSHETGFYSCNYEYHEDNFLQSTPFSPVFCSEFNLTILSPAFQVSSTTTGECAHYMSDNGYDYLGYDIAFCNDSIYYYNRSTATYNYIGKGRKNYTQTPFKICAFFSQKPGFPFNSTVEHDRIEIYTNVTYVIYPDEWDSRMTTLAKYQFSKGALANFIVDDYYVYAGTDKVVNTLDMYFKELVKHENTTLATGVTATTVEGAIFDMYATIGLNTAKSRLIAGLGFMIVINIFIIYIMVYYKFNVGAGIFGILNMLLIIFFSTINLFPLWIVILMGLAFAGFISVSVMRTLAGGGS